MNFSKEHIIKKLKHFVGIKTEEDLHVVKTPRQKIIDFIKSLGSAAIAALIIITFFVQNTRIPTGSMEDTILVGDFVLVNKFIFGDPTTRYIPFTEIRLPDIPIPGFREPKNTDIVVFEYPGDRDELRPKDLNVNYVKRCIGTPGDTVEIKDKVVFVNGKEFWIPSYIKYLSPVPVPKGTADSRIFPPGKPWNEDNYGPLVVPRKGDVIKLSVENIEEWRTIIDRELGDRAVNYSNGVVTINNRPVTSYTLTKDYYFMMGDNRSDSFDSRFWGFVPRDKVVGLAFITLFSWDREIPFSEPIRLLASARPDRILKLLR